MRMGLSVYHWTQDFPVATHGVYRAEMVYRTLTKISSSSGSGGFLKAVWLTLCRKHICSDIENVKNKQIRNCSLASAPVHSRMFARRCFMTLVEHPFRAIGLLLHRQREGTFHN